MESGVSRIFRLDAQELILDDPLLAVCRMSPSRGTLNSKLPWLRDYFEQNLRLDGAIRGPKGELANI